MYNRVRTFTVGMLSGMILAVACFCAGWSLAEAQVPRGALKHKRHLIAAVRGEFGLDAPLAMFAGQIHAESSWNCEAQSLYAEGCAQFTTDTADWASVRWADLNPPMVRSPTWAFRAMARYMAFLHERVPFPEECDRWAGAQAAYNGGLTWLRRDIELSGGRDTWWLPDGVYLYSNRAHWAFEENRRYPQRIMYDLQPIYVVWGGPTICLD